MERKRQWRDGELRKHIFSNECFLICVWFKIVGKAQEIKLI